MRLPTIPPRPTSRPQRGATIVEYSLLVAILAVGTLGAISFVQDSAKAKTEHSAEHISTRTIPTPTTADDEGHLPTTTSTPPTTTTEPPPPPPPSSTTTEPPPPTPTSATANWTGTSKDTRRRNGNDEWRANATIQVTDDLGNPVSGATVSVRISFRRGTSWQNVSTLSETTGSAGSLTVQSGYYRTSGTSRADEIRFSITSVSTPGLNYTGGQPIISVVR